LPEPVDDPRIVKGPAWLTPDQILSPDSLPKATEKWSGTADD
jgi:hypothetical protein